MAAAAGGLLVTGFVASVGGGVLAPVAGAVTNTQTNVTPAVDCAVNGLHQGTGPVSTCRDITITSEVLVNGSNAAAGSNLFAGDVITVRLTVAAEGGDNSLYEETVDGLRNNELSGMSDIQAYFNVGLPTQTGTQLSAPASVKMSRTDNGDRGSGPAINCLAHNGQEAAVSDSITNITVGAAAVGGTKMKAQVTGTTLRGTWDDMAWDRCRVVLSNNAVYPGHVLEFQQTVLAFTQSAQNLNWSLGQFTVARDDASRSLNWGANSNVGLTIVGDADNDGVVDTLDSAPNDACVPSNTVGACDRDGDGEINSIDTDDTDPCEDSGGITSFPGCDDDGDGVPSGAVSGSNGIAGVNGGAVDASPDNPCYPSTTSTACEAIGASFVKLTPKRIMDSRTGLATTAAKFGPGTSRALTVAGVNSVPTSATAVVLNVTATQGTASTYLTVWPTGVSRPTASNLNVKAARNRANLVIAPVGANGQVSIYNYLGDTHIVVDISGYFFPENGDGYQPVAPKRLMDTRYGIGGPASPFTAGAVRDLVIAGSNGVPSGATAAVVNLTAVGGTGTSYLTAYPKGSTRPTASNVNWIAGETSPNLAVVPLGTGGAISLYNDSATANVLVDVVGYMGPDGTGRFRPVTPVRLLDSRYGTGTTATPWAPNETRNKTIVGASIPSYATGFVGNLTSPGPTASSYFTVWPQGGTRPVVSNLNVVSGDTRANALVVGMSAAGGISLYNYVGNNHLIVDASGWFGPILFS